MSLPASVINTFAGNPLDRASERRGDAAFLAASIKDPHALALAVWRGMPLVEPAPEGGIRLAWLRADLLGDAVGGAADRLLFLGLWKETPVFAVEFDGGADPAEGPLKGLGRFEELRAAAAALPGPETGIAGTAKSLFDWRRRHGYCSACGRAVQVVDGGWKTRCPACAAEHFPRVDPVVIMLPVHGDRCLLGRQAAWPQGRMSALAGYVEPGESVEEACARELKEEAGLVCTRVVHHSSQPWPWPSQLMIGLLAEVASLDARPDQTELESVRWFHRDEIALMLADGVYDGVHAPPPLAIAHTLIRAFAGSGGAASIFAEQIR